MEKFLHSSHPHSAKNASMYIRSACSNDAKATSKLLASLAHYFTPNPEAHGVESFLESMERLAIRSNPDSAGFRYFVGVIDTGIVGALPYAVKDVSTTCLSLSNIRVVVWHASQGSMERGSLWMRAMHNDSRSIRPLCSADLRTIQISKGGRKKCRPTGLSLSR